MKSAEKLLNNLLNGSLELNHFRTWISNFTTQGVLEKNDEPITQIEFILYFLNFLKEKSRYVKSQIKKNLGNKPKTVITHQHHENNQNLSASQSNEEFSKEDFPTLENSVLLKQGTKSMRRINPTRIQKNIEEGKNRYPKNKQETKENVTCDISITKQTREKYANRFSSSLSVSKKKNVSYVPLNKETGKLPAQYEKKIIIIIEIYLCLLKNNVVPNLSDEIQFLLILFNDISVYTDEIIFVTNSYNDSTLLNHIIDWQYICIEIFIRLDSIILKMDCNIKTFLHKSISNFNFQSNKRRTLFLQKLEVPFYKNQIALIPFKELYEDTSGMNRDCFDSKHDAFFKLKKNWKLDGSDNALVELDFLLTFKDNITSMNSFGKIFVESLVMALEDSRRDNRLNKLTQRFSNRQYQEDNGFYHFEVFYKWIVDFCFVKCPQHLLYIKYWLLNFIKSLSKEYLSTHGTEAYDDVHLKNRFVSGLFIKITLAKFLGYIEFWEIKKYDNLPETEKLIQSIIQGNFTPRIDISGMLLWAVQEGQLTNTIPWIVQFISMSNKFIYSLPYYKEILTILISISSSRQVPLSKEDNLRVSKKLILNDEEDSLVKLSILTPLPKFLNSTESRKFNFNIIFLKKSSMLFLNLWIGKLFNNKILGEDIYFNILQEYINIVKETKLNLDTVPVMRTTDSVFEVDEEIFLLLCSHFSKMTYWEQNVSTTPNKLVRNIRPILLESDEEQTSTDDIDVRAMLEDQFLKDNKNLSIIIDSITNSVFGVFSNKIDKLVPHKELEEGHYCKLKELIEECHLRIDQSITALIQNDAEKPMRDVTISICFRRFINEIKKWLILQDFEVGNEFFINLENVPETCNIGNQCNINPKLSTALKNLNVKIIELNKNECVEQNINATADDLIMVCKEIFAKNDALNRTREYPFWDDLHILSWDYVLEILTNKPQLITEAFLEKMSLLWKEYFESENNAERLFCPHLIKASILKDKSKQKLIALKSAFISFWILKHKLATIEELEQAYLGILRHTWNEDELNFLLMTFIEINACVKKQDQRELLSTIDFVLDSIIDIMDIDNMKKDF